MRETYAGYYGAHCEDGCVSGCRCVDVGVDVCEKGLCCCFSVIAASLVSGMQIDQPSFQNTSYVLSLINLRVRSVFKSDITVGREASFKKAVV